MEPVSSENATWGSKTRRNRTGTSGWDGSHWDRRRDGGKNES